MTDFLTTLSFSFAVTGPIFVVVALGIWLRHIALINDAFVETGSKLVFNVALPALLFISISKTHISQSANLPLIVFGAMATVLAYLLLEWLASFTVSPPEDRGVVVQGAFRSNMGIIGLAYCTNVYGEAGLVAASLYLGLITILFNILAVITLSRSLHKDSGNKVMRILRGIARNPLIIGIVLALPVSWLELPIPPVLLKSGEYFAQMTLPLALLCTGASLSFHSMRHELANTLQATMGKLVLIPLLFATGAISFGFQGMDLGIILLMSFAPTAAASYIMVRAMAGNSALAANIVAMTTVGSLLTTSLGITLLKSAGMI